MGARVVLWQLLQHPSVTHPSIALESGDPAVESRSTLLKGNSALQRDDAPQMLREPSELGGATPGIDCTGPASQSGTCRSC
jgi:hypothetical protein